MEPLFDLPCRGSSLDNVQMPYWVTECCVPAILACQPGFKVANVRLALVTECCRDSIWEAIEGTQAETGAHVRI